jgi:sugar lactone lactonase YvrE
MPIGVSVKCAFAAAVLALTALPAARLFAQANAAPNSQPNPYRTVTGWAQLPEGRKWGSMSAVDIDPQGHIWVVDRCEANSCAGSNLNPVFEFDKSGKMLKNWGAGMFIFPHGIYCDRAGNIWITDGQGANGKGHQVFKFSPDGKVLMTLGKAGVTGNGPDTFNAPSDVLVAPNGDIFVADGHDARSNARIVKFNKNGKYIKEWGKHGSGPGDIEIPHTLAMDSKGRLFEGDRQNNRIQIFDQDGKLLDIWTQFGRPSGLFIDKNDMIYVADSESNETRHPGWKRGIRIGSAKDGAVIAFIPDPNPSPDSGAGAATSAAEGVAADADGNVYGAEVGPKDLKRYVKN